MTVSFVWTSQIATVAGSGTKINKVITTSMHNHQHRWQLGEGCLSSAHL